MSKLRFDVVQDAFKKKAAAVETPAGKISDYFGELVFNRDKMHKYLDAKTFNALVNCIDNGEDGWFSPSYIEHILNNLMSVTLYYCLDDESASTAEQFGLPAAIGIMVVTLIISAVVFYYLRPRLREMF